MEAPKLNYKKGLYYAFLIIDLDYCYLRCGVTAQHTWLSTIVPLVKGAEGSQDIRLVFYLPVLRPQALTTKKGSTPGSGIFLFGPARAPGAAGVGGGAVPGPWVNIPHHSGFQELVYYNCLV